MVPLEVVTVFAVLPVLEAPEAVTTARPCAMHAELKVTVSGAVLEEYRLPFWSTTETVRLVEPPAERLALAMAMAPG